MAESGPIEDDRPSWCIISLMVTFNAVLNLCHALSFLWIFFLRLKITFKNSGAWWIFSNCCIDIIQFFVMSNFTFRYFNNRIPRKALTICLSFSFGLSLCLQIASLIIGSIRMKMWTSSTSSLFQTTYLVYIILSWCFLGSLLVVILVCCLVDYYRKKHSKEDAEIDDRGCCCHSDRECCSRCNRCCIGYEVDPSRERINNSCCCDCCCSCCIDCCIDCCGEVRVKLPDNLSENDVVVINPHHRIIYAPDPSRIDSNNPVTMSSTNQNLSGLAGVGSFQNNRQFFPAVFYSDVTTAQGKTPLYIIPSDIPNKQALFSNAMAPVIPVAATEVVESPVTPRDNNTPRYIVIDGVKYVMRTSIV